MTTAQPAPKIPAHGTQYRYKGARNGAWPPCRCKTCTRAHTRAGTLRKLAHLNGTPPLHPTEPVLEHIALLNASGMKNDLIARRASISSTTLNYLTRGITKKLRRENALKILAVLPGDFDDIAYKPALGSIRRIRALYAIGHGSATIAAIAELDRMTVSHIANGYYQQLSGRVARAIAYAYQQLKFTPGTSRRAVQVARRHDWPSPLAWDGNIDEPQAEPDLTNPADRELGRNELARERRQDVWLLRTAAVPEDEIAARVGVTTGTVRVIVDEFRTGKKKDRRKKQEAAA